MPKRRVFVGSSGKAIAIARAIQEDLGQEFEFTLWPHSFQPSTYPLEELEREVSTHDFGLFVFSDDDYLVRTDTKNEPNQSYHVTRDNVVFEAGLFIARLGRERVIIIRPNVNNYHLPSDMNGLTLIEYVKPPETATDIRGALATACTVLRRRLLQVAGYPAVRPARITLLANTEQKFNEGLLLGLYRRQRKLHATIHEVRDRGGPNFISDLRTAVAGEPDFLIIVTPGDAETNSPKMREILCTPPLNSRCCIFIEGTPSYAPSCDHIYSVQLDMRAYTETLTETCLEASKLNSSDFILIVPGPWNCSNANLRRKIMEDYIAGRGIPFHTAAHNDGWEEEVGYKRVSSYIEEPENRFPQMIICGNDSMALGGSRAVLESRRAQGEKMLPLVVGFDGLPDAIRLIRDPKHPFFATTKVGTESYCDTIEHIISRVMAGHRAEPVVTIDGHSAIEVKPSTNGLRRS